MWPVTGSYNTEGTLRRPLPHDTRLRRARLYIWMAIHKVPEAKVLQKTLASKVRDKQF